jgi:hypothetical protein
LGVDARICCALEQDGRWNQDRRDRCSHHGVADEHGWHVRHDAQRCRSEHEEARDDEHDRRRLQPVRSRAINKTGRKARQAADRSYRPGQCRDVVGERKRCDRDRNRTEEESHRHVDPEEGRNCRREQAAVDQPAIAAPMSWRFGTMLPDERHHPDDHETASHRQSRGRVQHSAQRGHENRTAQERHVIERGFQRQCRRNLVRRMYGVPPASRRQGSHLRDAGARHHRHDSEHHRGEAQMRADDQPRDGEDKDGY